MNKPQENEFATSWLIVEFLYRSTVFGFALVLACSLPLLLTTDTVYQIHNWFIAIERPTYNAMMFEFLGNLKIFIIVFFFIPAIGLHWTLKLRQAKTAGSA